MRAGVRALFASVSLLLIVASGVASVNFNGFTLVLGCID
jgi:hypothetical protein